MPIKKIVIFVIISLFVLGCTKIYHKKFIISDIENSVHHYVSHDYKDFNIPFFIEAYPPGTLYSGKKKPLDSLFSVHLRVNNIYTKPKLKIELLESFTIHSLKIELNKLDSLITCTSILVDTIYNSMRVIDYEHIMIPEIVDTIYVHLSFDYLNNENKLVSESSKIMMFRSEGHYNVPLGFMMD